MNDLMCRALIDTDAGSSYASAKIHELKIKPKASETKRIDMLMCSKDTILESYEVKIQSIDREFELNTDLIKVEKSQLLEIENPKYANVIESFPHLEGGSATETETKTLLPIHIVLGNRDYSRIKTETPARIGKDREPVAELTKMGWVIMSPGQELDRESMLLT